MLEEADPQSSPVRIYSGRERLATSLLLGGLLLSNVVVFGLLGRNYLDWYIAHGTEIGLAFAFVAVVVDLDAIRSSSPTPPGSTPKALGAWSAS